MSVVGANPGGIQCGDSVVTVQASVQDYVYQLEATVVYLANWSGYLDSGCALDIVRDQILSIKRRRDQR